MSVPRAQARLWRSELGRKPTPISMREGWDEGRRAQAQLWGNRNTRAKRNSPPRRGVQGLGRRSRRPLDTARESGQTPAIDRGSPQQQADDNQ